MAGRIEGVPLPQCFGLDPWEFVKTVRYWIETGNDQVYLEGINRILAGWLVALDWEQPAQEDMDIQEGRGIARF